MRHKSLKEGKGEGGKGGSDIDLLSSMVLSDTKANPVAAHVTKTRPNTTEARGGFADLLEDPNHQLADLRLQLLGYAGQSLCTPSPVL